MTTPGIVVKKARDALGVPFNVQFFDDGSGNLIDDVPISNGTALTPSDGATVAPGRQFAVIAASAGNVKIELAGGLVVTIPVQAGFTLLPWQVIKLFSTGTTAVGTFLNMV